MPQSRAISPITIVFFVLSAIAMLVFWRVRDVLMPFIAGLILAYICAPTVGWMVQKHVPRGVAVASVMLGLLAFIALLALLIVPRLVQELTQFITDLPSYATILKQRVETANVPWLRDVLAERTVEVQNALSSAVEKLTTTMASVFSLAWTHAQGVISGVLVFVLTPIIAFYLLMDWAKLVVHFEHLIPRAWLPQWRAISTDMNRALKGYFQGQSMVCACLALYYSSALSLTGLNYGFLIGVMAGIFSFVPYVGSIGGAVTALLVAFTQFWPHNTMIWVVLGVFAFGQILEGYILAPKLVGDKVGLHPVWIFLALFVFGALLGFVGLVLAVPIAAILGVAARHGVQYYRTTAYYNGKQSPKE